MRTTRAIRVEVVFDGYRRADLEAPRGPRPASGAARETWDAQQARALWPRLHRARRELTVGANRAITALYAVVSGTVPQPTWPEGHKDAGQPRHPRTLAYQAFSGDWMPGGRPLYEPTERLAGMVQLGTATAVYQRIQTDLRDVLAGRQTLPTFRELPIIIAGQGITLLPDRGAVSLLVWGGRRNNRVTVRPVHLDAGQGAIWRRILTGDVKHGDAKLTWDERRRKWFLSLAWSSEMSAAEGDLVAGVDLSVPACAILAYVDRGGTPTGRRDQIHTPRRIVRAWERLEHERSGRLRFGRVAIGERSGRGRLRKLRAVEHLSGVRARMAEDVARQVAAAIVDAARRRGAAVIAVERLTGCPDSYMDATADDSRRGRARRRKWFLAWQQGRIREAVASAATREGLAVVEVDPAHTSTTCHVCGREHRYNSAEPRREKREARRSEFGRVPGYRFRCECGYTSHCGYNAAVNVARRGLDAERA